MKKVLKMQFKTLSGSNATLSLDDPSASLTDLEVKTAMQNIVDADVFANKNGKFTEIVGAKVVETSEREFDLEV